MVLYYFKKPRGQGGWPWPFFCFRLNKMKPQLSAICMAVWRYGGRRTADCGNDNNFRTNSACESSMVMMATNFGSS
jgi:hypothetical protein